MDFSCHTELLIPILQNSAWADLCSLSACTKDGTVRGGCISLWFHDWQCQYSISYIPFSIGPALVAFILLNPPETGGIDSGGIFNAVFCNSAEALIHQLQVN